MTVSGFRGFREFRFLGRPLWNCWHFRCKTITFTHVMLYTHQWHHYIKTCSFE